MSEFEPTLVYICPGIHQRPGGTFSTEPANSQEELDALLNSGYSATLPEAIEGPKENTDDNSDDDNPPTRSELEAKATELGIAFKANWKDSTIADKIDKALADGVD